MPRKYLPLEHHGHRRKGYRSPTYISWEGMRGRCNNPKSIQYKDYGGRGIRIDPSWDSFSVFLKDMGERPDTLSLDRINTDGNYCKENCRWATTEQQWRSRRSTYSLHVNGKLFNLTELANEYEININSLRVLINSGIPPEKAITLAVKRKAG